MRIIRKLMLATLAVGFVGLLFGNSVKADEYDYKPMEVKVYSNNDVEIFWPNEYVYDKEDEDYHKTEYDFGDNSTEIIRVGGTEVGRFSGYDCTEQFNLSDLIDEKIENGELSGSKYAGYVEVEIRNALVDRWDAGQHDYWSYLHDGDWKEETVKNTSVEKARGIYKITVTKNGEGRVKAYIGSTLMNAESDSFYAFEGESLDLIAEETSDGYEFSKWSDNGSQEHSVTIKDAVTYTAEFKKAATGLSLTVNGKTGKVDVFRDSKITLAATVSPSGAGYKKITYYPESNEYFSKNGTTWTAIKNTSGRSVKIYAEIENNKGKKITSNTVEVTISEKVDIPCEGFSIKADETYVTDGYMINLVPDFTKMGTLYNGINWTLEGDGSLSGVSTYTQSGKKSVSDIYGVVLIANGEKVEAGKTRTLKVTATIPKGKSSTEDAVATIDITVYPLPTVSLSDEKSLSYKAPDKVNTGLTDGVDGDNKDVTKTKISEVKGVKLHVLNKDEKFLGMTAVAKEKGKSETIDSATIGKLTGSISSSLTGDSADIKIRAFPCDSDGKYNKNVHATTSLTVYKVVVTYTKADGSTADYITYRPEGSKLNVADAIAEVASTADGKVTQVDGTSETTVTVSSSAAKNKHTAVLGASRTAADAAGGAGAAKAGAANDSALDKVPKTGQSNTFVFVMVAVVVCAVGGGLYAYNKKVKKA